MKKSTKHFARCFLLAVCFGISTVSTTLDAVTYRYLRLTVNEIVSSTFRPYFHEIEWMDGATSYPTTKITTTANTGGAASVSSSIAGTSNNNLFEAFDGITTDANSMWMPNSPPLPYSVTLDLGVGNSIYPTALKLQFATFLDRGIKSYDCEGSNDNAIWTTLKSVTNTATVGGSNTITIPAASTDAVAPSAPTGLASGTITGSQIGLTWTASTDAVGVTGYKVYKGTDLLTTTVSNSYTATGLTSSTSYSFQVSAIDAAGNESVKSSILAVSTSSGTPEVINLFWLGNSFTGNTNLPLTVKNMINSNPACGKTVNLSNANILPGQNLDAHAANATSMAGVRSGSYDYVILQGIVRAGSNNIEIMRDSMVAAGTRISNEVKANGGIPLVFAAHAACTSDQQMWDLITSCYRQFSDAANDVFVPCGLSWVEAKLQMPSLVTHDIDCHHQGEVGNYLNACVFYYKLTGVSPVGLTYKTSNAVTFDDAIALVLQQAAATVVERELAVYPVTAISFPASTLTVLEGSSSTITATVSPSNATDKSISWSSSNPSVASVDISGTIVGVSLGTATITGTTNDGGFTAQCEITVVESNLIRVSSVALEAPTMTMYPSQKRSFLATILPANASNQVVSWRTSNPLVATISTSGLVTGVATGTTTITVTTQDGLKTAECLVTVSLDTEAPSVPAGLSAATLTHNTLVLNWTASTDNAGVTGYDIYRWTTLVGSTTTTSYTATGLTPETSYNFTVKAKDAANNISAASSPLSVTTATAPPGFRYLKLTALGQTSNLGIYFNEIEWMEEVTAYPTTKLTGPSASVTSSITAIATWAESHNAFNGTTTGNAWVPIDDSGSGYPYSVTLDLGVGTKIYPTAIRIAIAYKGRSLSAFRCDGSNDKSTWTTLLNVSGKVESNWLGDAFNTFAIPAYVATAATSVNIPTVALYPNPVLNELNLNFGTQMQKADVTLLDLQGRNLISKSIANSSLQTIDVSSLNNGVYFVKLIVDGKQSNTKFVKK